LAAPGSSASLGGTVTTSTGTVSLGALFFF